MLWQSSPDVKKNINPISSVSKPLWNVSTERRFCYWRFFYSIWI